MFSQFVLFRQRRNLEVDFEREGFTLRSTSSNHLNPPAIAYSKVSRQRGRVIWSVVFTTAMIAKLWFNSHPSLVVTSLNKMLHDNYLCLVESNEQQIEKIKSKIQAENSETRQLLSESGFVLCIALPSLSRDRRIKTKKSINSSITLKSMFDYFALTAYDQLNLF